MRFTIIFLLLCSISLSAQKISNRKIQKQIEAIPHFNQAIIGISIKEMKASNTVVSFHDARYMTPASNTKILTYLASVQHFDSLPALQYAITPDSLTHIRSTGYPLLLHPLYEDSGLNAFFKQQKALVYHLPTVAPKRLGSGWSWDDYGYYFAAETSAFPIYGNVVALTKDSLSAKVKVHPPYFQTKITSDTLLINIPTRRAEHENNYLINPTKWKPQTTRYAPFRTSDSLFVKLLSQAFEKPVTLTESDAQTLRWKTLYSAIPNTLYKGLMHDSDNLIAESLLLMLAKKQTDSLDTRKAIKELQEKWSAFLPDPLEWVDGSGVSRYNMFTPRSLTAVLQELQKTVGWETLKDIFPATQLVGIRYPEGERKTPYVYAKTGTLRHNVLLSGYLIGKKNKRYAFSIMVNHATAPTRDVREGIGSLLAFFRKKLK